MHIGFLVIIATTQSPFQSMCLSCSSENGCNLIVSAPSLTRAKWYTNNALLYSTWVRVTSTVFQEMIWMGSISQYFFEELALFSCQIRVYVIFQYPFNYWYKLNHLSLAWTGEKLTNIAFDSCVICAWPSHCSTGRHFNSIFCLMRCTHYFDSNNRKSTQTCTLLYFTQF